MIGSIWMEIASHKTHGRMRKKVWGGERPTMRMRAGCKARTGQSGGEGEVSVQRRLPMRRECVWREKGDVTIVQKR